MKIVVFQHFNFDDPERILSWCKEAGHEVIVHDPSEGIDANWLANLELLIILGGPMSVYDETEHPWLIAEKMFVKAAIDAGKKVLGICLGAQMIAEVLGGRVYPNLEKEIGWHTMYRTKENHPWLEGMPQEFTTYSWHGDTFTLPLQARHLMYSKACNHQAFAYGEHVLGLQFHLESTSECISNMLKNWSNELQEAPYVQSATQIREGMFNSEQSKQLLWGILDRIQASHGGSVQLRAEKLLES